ncbi:type 3 dihydrofolate reductase [Agaribacter flavus]|uniref:Dihydrofolate reductase n=1 Tax=Agaribacter flavus TaxID=1902781 RepID=A0ABV7FSI4_9ALTE
MKISMIAAMAKNRIIGKNNQMPWHLPADLRHFKMLTLGKPVVMGRLTYESIGKALPGRHNIVISRDPSYQLDDASTAQTIESALSLASSDDVDEIMIIGGGTVYDAVLPKATHLHLTLIDAELDGDTAFPDYNTIAEWEVLSEEKHLADDKNPYNYEFVSLARVT